MRTLFVQETIVGAVKSFKRSSGGVLSRTQINTQDVTWLCQEICDIKKEQINNGLPDTLSKVSVRVDLGSHLKYSQRWSGVRAGVLLGAQGAVRRGESRGRL